MEHASLAMECVFMAANMHLTMTPHNDKAKGIYIFMVYNKASWLILYEQ
jgi:hypothetical protein